LLYFGGIDVVSNLWHCRYHRHH